MGEPAAPHVGVVAMVVNMAGVLDAAVAGTPDRAALVIDDEPVSYRQLGSATAACASLLVERGAKAHDRIAVVDWGGVPAVAATLAAAHIGGAAAPMNPMLTRNELAQLVSTAGCASVGVAGVAFAGALQDALGGNAPITEKDLDAASPASAPPREGGGDTEALVLFTSGTTGLPKAVPITHDAIDRRIREYRAPFDPERPASVSLMCVPAFHVGGLLGLILNLYSGDTTVIQPRFDAGEWLALVERHRVASTFLVPTMLARILDHPAFAATDLSSITSIAYGAAAMPPSVIRRAMEALPQVNFANTFGQTETLGAYTTLSPADHHDPARAGSVGRPLPGVAIRIVDPNGNDVPPGEAGELWVDSPQNVRPGWLHTGDLARQDADGFVYPIGRLSDTINRGGEKFGPIEVSEAVRAHPAVSDVAVAGIADPEMGERVGVAVVPRPGTTAPTLEELRTWCRDRLASYKLPEILVVVESLPYNDLGKLSRRAAAELIANKAGA
jgi:acyl-CoA synthetase (AMP-forming)/AMP-acid ligase II